MHFCRSKSQNGPGEECLDGKLLAGKDLKNGLEKVRLKKSPSAWPLYIGIICLILLAFLSMMVGVADIFAPGKQGEMLFITRIPRTAALLLSGAAMSMCGMIMQLITGNKMVEPGTVGAGEWASLGLLLAYILLPSPGILSRISLAVFFSFVGTMLFFLILQKIRLKSSVIVPIVGLMFGAVISAVSAFLSLQFDASQVLEGWFVGSFSGVQIGRYEYLWLIILITLAVYLYADRITVASLGRDLSKNLGVSYEQVVIITTALVSGATGIVCAVIGNLPFIGLIVPNIISIARGDNARENLPYICILGMICITFCDILSRVLIQPFEVPVSLILGTIGAFVFIFILLWQRRTA